jgi:hypothetical protein
MRARVWPYIARTLNTMHKNRSDFASCAHHCQPASISRGNEVTKVIVSDRLPLAGQSLLSTCAKKCLHVGVHPHHGHACPSDWRRPLTDVCAHATYASLPPEASLPMPAPVLKAHPQKDNTRFTEGSCDHPRCTTRTQLPAPRLLPKNLETMC